MFINEAAYILCRDFMKTEGGNAEHTPHKLAAPFPGTAVPQVHKMPLSLPYKFPHPLYVTQVYLVPFLLT